MLIFNSPRKITAQTKEFPELLLQTGKLSCSIIQPRKGYNSRNLFIGNLSKVQHHCCLIVFKKEKIAYIQQVVALAA
jgi:hypothetical protein